MKAPRRAAVAMALAIIGWHTAALAATDYDPQSAEWHGLQALVDLAVEAKAQVSATRVLDWSQLDERQVLMLVGPQQPPSDADRAALHAFLAAGGRLIVVDDHSAGNAWLAGSGLVLASQAGRSRRTYSQQPALPMVTIDRNPASLALLPWRQQAGERPPYEFLGHNLVQPVVLNHPGSLRVGGAGVLWGRFDLCPGMLAGACGWLAEASWQGSRVLAVADGSLVTNQMIAQVHENRQFAANLLRYYCVAERPCRVHVAAALRATKGQFVARHARSGWLSRSGLEAVDQWLRGIANGLSVHSQSLWLWLAAVLAMAWTIRRTLRVSPPAVPPPQPPVRDRSAVHGTIAAWLDTPSADYRAPARLLAMQLVRSLDRLESPALAEASVQARTSRLPSGAWRRAPTAVDALVQRGHLPVEAAARLREALSNLQRVTQDDAPPLSRQRFGVLAAEIEWAEAVLQHTVQIRPDKGAPG